MIHQAAPALGARPLLPGAVLFTYPELPPSDCPGLTGISWVAVHIPAPFPVGPIYGVSMLAGREVRHLKHEGLSW